MLVLPVSRARGKLLLEGKKPCPGTPVWCIGLATMAICAQAKVRPSFPTLSLWFGRFGPRLPRQPSSGESPARNRRRTRMGGRRPAMTGETGGRRLVAVAVPFDGQIPCKQKKSLAQAPQFGV